MNALAPVDRTTLLRETYSGRLSVASLRRATPMRVWGGKGSGTPCDFCRVLVSASDMEYEIEVQLDGETLTLHFHPRCYEAWRADQQSSAAPDSPG